MSLTVECWVGLRPTYKKFSTKTEKEERDMELLAGLLGIVGFLIFAATALGVIFPSIFKNRSTGEVPKRAGLLFKGVGLALVFAISAGLLAPTPESSANTAPIALANSAPESRPATVQASPAVDPQPATTQESLEFTADEKSAYCTSFGLTFATAVKAKHDGISFDALYESPRAMAKFVVKDGNAAKKARIEKMLTDLMRNIQNGPEEDFAPMVTAMAEHGFDTVMQGLALGCKQDGMAP